MFLINVLRTLAMCLITNSHYTDVYPIEALANGGLLGDIIFFAVSGFCLAYTKKNFIRWYGKRLFRILPPVIFITVIYLICGFYNFNRGFVYWFIYPTAYHFVLSILILYIPLYFVSRYEIIKKYILWVFGVVALLYLIVYVLIYDKSYYHIDTVREPMILFLYFESMLLGVYFRINYEKYRNKIVWWHVVAFAVSLGLYVFTKLIFSKGIIVEFQFLNQITIFALLYFTFLIFMGLDSKLEKLPKGIKKIIIFLSKLTLEIYVVQSVIINCLSTILIFPLNWFIVTSSILLAAWILHIICKAFENCIIWLKNKVKINKKGQENI